MTIAMMKARLRAAAQRAKLPGESVTPEIVERSGGTATVGVIFKKGRKSVEDVSHHGSWYTQDEREKLIADTIKSLQLRSKRSSSR